MEMENDLYYEVFVTENTVNHKFYVGVRPNFVSDPVENYIGGGIFTNDPYTYQFSKTPLQQAVKEFGVRKFKYHPIFDSENRDEAYELYGKIVNEKTIRNAMMYNQIIYYPIDSGLQLYAYYADGGIPEYMYEGDENDWESVEAAECGNVLYGKYYCYLMENNYSWARKHWIQTRPVYKYDYETGILLKSYNSQEEAEKDNKYSNITRAIKFKRPCKNGFMWSIEELDYFVIPKYRKSWRNSLSDLGISWEE